MKKLSSYLMEHKFGYLLGFVSMVIAVSLDMVSPQLTKHIIDDVIVGGRIEILKYLLGGILIVGAGRCVFGYTKEFTFDRIGSSIATDMRKDLFSHIQSLSADYFDKTNTGELMSRVKDDIDRIWNAVSYVSMLILEVVFHTGIVLFCMYRLNWKLALIPTAAMLITGTIAILEERRLGVIYEDISEENAVLNTVAEENLAGVRTVKAFAREKFEIGKFLSHNNRYYELNMRQSKVFVKYYPYFSLITKLLPLIILFFGGGLVIQGKLSIGSLSAFVEYSMNIVWPMEMLGWLSNDFSSAVGSYRKIRKIYNVKPSISEPEVPEILPAVKGKVEFRNVSFHKEDGYEILHDISFCVQPGNTIGIMGATGAGKTSIIQLLQRLYDATDGNVYVDDVDIRNLSLKQLRSNISLVMQDVFLFSGTIRSNIVLREDNISDEEIMQVCRYVNADHFINKLDHGLDEEVRERGNNFSAGQRQLLSFARTIIHKPSVMILDKATANIDTETELLIQDSLEKMRTVGTMLIVAHRLSTIQHADNIIVLSHGKILEQGSHQELLARHGRYYQLYTLQYHKEQLSS